MNASPTNRQSLRPIDLNLTPVEAAQRLALIESDLVFLDSSNDYGASQSQPSAHFSLLAARPLEVITGQIANPTDRNRLRATFDHHAPADAATFDCGFPVGGAFGSIDYDGTFRFGIYADTLIFDHHLGTWQETGDSELAQSLSTTPQPVTPQKIDLQPITDRPTFCRMIDQARDYITAGDIYQVNLSHKFTGTFSGGDAEAFALYQNLRDASPAPYAAFLKSEDRRVLSSSPELFTSLTNDNHPLKTSV